MQKITPFLWFDKEAEEAMHFYTTLFTNAPNPKGESKIKSIQYYPEGFTEGPMAGMEGKVLTGTFVLDGQEFMALDGGPIFKPNESMSLLVDCGTQEEIDYFWNGFLNAGGTASECGWLKDKYGFSWQIVPQQMDELFNGPDKEGNKRAIQAMLGMKKIIIADLQKAYEGRA